MHKTGGKGQSMVEVALAMPLLILILVGILDLGRAFFTYITISDAAAEGAAYASVHPNDTIEVTNRVVDSSNGLVLLDSSMVTIQPPVTIAAGSPITVTVDFEYTVITPLISSFVSDGLTLRAVAVQSIITP
jgi:Flp pilus assembly protein TadG